MDEELLAISKEGIYWPSTSMQMAAELLERREESRKTCNWKLDNDGFFETACGHGFTLNDGTLGENRLAFCPYCGHSIEEAT